MDISLHIPQQDELFYRQKLLSDPETMSYNRGYPAFSGYNPSTGCITFSQADFDEWYKCWIGGSDRFYAYIESCGEFVGEVNLHPAEEKDTYNMGIVVEAKYRGKGISEAALKLLLKTAFVDMNAAAVYNSFERIRHAARKVHIKCGFRFARETLDMLYLVIRRERYFALYPAE